MNINFSSLCYLGLSLPVACAIASSIALASTLSPALAQSITPANDGTGTNVNTNGNQIDISGGTQAGNNLFQSFQQFRLDSGQIANFLSNPSIVNILGRVTGGDASIINGLIQVTGGNSNLYLMNPAGIVFGQNASLNVPASFNATTATGIGFGNNLWFNATGANSYSALIGTPNQFVFNTAQPGSIVNSGNLAVTAGNSLTLIGGNVVSTGSLQAPGGNITIAAVPGENLVKISQANNILSLEVAPPSAPNGTALPFTPLSLPQLLTGTGGTVTKGLTVNNNQVTLASTGTVLPEGATAIASGNINVSNSTGTGGTAAVLGDKVGVLGGNIDASGKNGGGTVLIGGDFQGKGNVPNASRTIVSNNSTIDASATDSGNGGRVIVWADNATSFNGAIAAKGGANAGDGGFVEVSGKETLAYNGSTDTLAPKGQAGTLLLDPRIINIDASSNPVGTPTFASNVGATQSIGAANLASALGTGNVILQADNSINFNAAVNVTSGTNSLILQAGKGVAFNTGGSLTLNGGSFTATINDPGANATERNAPGAGSGSFLMNPGTTLNTNGGNVTVIAGTHLGLTGADSGVGVRINGATINAGAGNINITGRGSDGTFAGVGITIDGSGRLQTTSGSITLNGSTSVAGSRGVFIQSSQVTTTGGNVNITGEGAGTGNTNTGVRIENNAQVTATGAGNINITGTIPTGAVANNFGIFLFNTAIVRSENGNITITGTGQGNFGNNDGIGISSGLNRIESTGAGSIKLIGTVANTNGSISEAIYGENVTIKTASGNIDLIGTANGISTGGSPGILLINAGVESSGGNISLNGTNNTTGGNNNYGIGLINITAKTTGTGSISLDGTGGNGNVGNHGILLNSNANVTSLNGNINLTGKASGTGAANHGISIWDGGVVQSTGTGTITLTGTSNATGFNNDGISIGSSLNSRVQSNQGNITLTGTSGTGVGSQDGIGIFSTGKVISQSGNISATGTTRGSGNDNNGIVLLNDGQVTTTSGALNLQGASTNTLGTTNVGIGILGNSLINGGTGKATLTADEINISADNSKINGTGILQLQQLNPTTGITIGGMAGDTRLNLIDPEIARVATTFSQIIIGRDDSSGAITLGSNLSVTPNLTIQSPVGAGTIDTNNFSLTGAKDVNLIANTKVTVSNNLNSTAGNIAITSNEIDLTGGANTVSGTKMVTLRPNDLTRNIDVGVATNGATALSLTTTDILALKAGFTQIAIGRADSTGIVKLFNSVATGGSTAFKDPVNIAGGNTLIAPDLNNIWNLTGIGTGDLNSTFSRSLTFNNIRNLQGGAVNDTFRFNPGASIQGNINGVNTLDTLDYSAYNAPVTVKLGTDTPGTATGVGGTILSIENVIGSATFATTNFLVGPDRVNTWKITGPNSGDVNGVTFSNFANLTGGNNNDTFAFNPNSNVSGNIDGSAGFDTLDYSAYSAPFTVNLPANAATATGGVFNIEQYTPVPAPTPVPVPTPAPVPVPVPAPTPTPAAQLIAPPEYENLRQRMRSDSVTQTEMIAFFYTDDEALNVLDSLLPEIVDYLNQDGGTLSVKLGELLPIPRQNLLLTSENQIVVRQNLIGRVRQLIGAEFVEFVTVDFNNEQDNTQLIVKVKKSPNRAVLKK